MCACMYIYTENIKTIELRNPSTLQKTKEVNYTETFIQKLIAERGEGELL